MNMSMLILQPYRFTTGLITCRSLFLLYCHLLRFWAMLRGQVAGEDDASSQRSSASSSMMRTLEDLNQASGKRAGKPPKVKKQEKKKRRKQQQQAEEADLEDWKAMEEEGRINKGEVEAPASPKAAARAKASAAAPRSPAVPQEEAPAESAAKQKKPKKKQQATKWLENVSASQISLFILIMKQMLQLTQGQRELQGALYDIITLPANSEMATVCHRQGKRYSTAVSQRGHGLGPPHLYVMGALLDYLFGLNSTFKQSMDAYEALSLTGRSELIKICRIAKLFNPELKKLVLMFGPGPEAQSLRKKILEELTQIDRFELKCGQAPKGHMERELQEWLVNLL
jgi:chemotaxis protein histidine kinase CheA